MKQIYIALLAAAALVGCSKGENGMEPTPDNNNSDEIRIASAIDATGESKAAVTEITAMTGIHFLKVDGATTKPANMTGATAFTGSRAANTTGAITWVAAPKYDKTANKNAYLVGVYPGPNSTEATAKGTLGTGTVTWTIDGKTDILVSPIWNAGTYAVPLTGSATPKLTFEHQLAQLCVVLKGETGTAQAVNDAAWGNITEVALLAYPTATYTYATAEATAVSYTGSMTYQKLFNADSFGTTFVTKAVPASDNTSVNASGMFAPSTGTISIRIKSTIGADQIATVQLLSGTTNKDFVKGMKHTVTLTLKAKDKAIDVTSTSITAWAPGYLGSGELEK